MASSSSDKNTSPKKKEKLVQIRVDPELHAKAKEQAKKHGWTLSSVMRAFLELFATEGPGLDPKDIGRAAESAPKSGRKKKKDGTPTPPHS